VPSLAGVETDKVDIEAVQGAAEDHHVGGDEEPAGRAAHLRAEEEDGAAGDQPEFQEEEAGVEVEAECGTDLAAVEQVADPDG